eukprot:500776_1
MPSLCVDNQQPNSFKDTFRNYLPRTLWSRSDYHLNTGKKSMQHFLRIFLQITIITNIILIPYYITLYIEYFHHDLYENSKYYFLRIIIRTISQFTFISLYIHSIFGKSIKISFQYLIFILFILNVLIGS